MELNIVIIIGLFGVLAAGENSTNTSQEWSEWKVLQEYPICFLIRTRQCLSDSCNETKEYKYCQDIASWGEWGPLQCTTLSSLCFIGRARNCSIQALPDCFSNENNTDITVLGDSKSCPCGEGGNSTNTSQEWSEWYVLQEEPKCLLTRTRQCMSNNCNKDEKEYKYCKEIASWGEWGPLQCTVRNHTCFIARARNCSIMTLSDCDSNETNHEVTVWGNFKSCPCSEGRTDSAGQEGGHWEEWNKWQCTTFDTHCYIYRTRNCSVQSSPDCLTSEGSQIKLWTDTCPCQKNLSSQGTEHSNGMQVNSSLSSASWLEWSGWERHRVNIGCMGVRRRLCSSNEIDCKGESYQLDIANICNGSSSNSPTIGTNNSILWSQWECHRDQIPCVLYRHQLCKSQSGLEQLCTDNHFEIKGCDESCKGSTAITTAGTITTSSSPLSLNVTSSMVSTSPTSVVAHSSPLSTGSVDPTTEYVPPYWLEWSSWKCLNLSDGICFRIRNRNCSTNINECKQELDGNNTDYVLCSNSICPATWEEWGNWSCKMGNNGSCSMTRTRECSTGDPQDCRGEPEMSEDCSTAVCPDKVKLEQSGQCRNYVSEGNKCTGAASTCNIITDTSHPICSDEHVSHKLCPRECGCCEEKPDWSGWTDWKYNIMTNGSCEMKRTRNCSIPGECKGVSEIITKCSYILFPEIPHWQDWGAWECALAPNHTCQMNRSRECSNSSECVGQPTMTSACNETICKDIITLAAKVNCSAFDPFIAKCEDLKGCAEFKTDSALDVVCSEPKMAAECPIMCGCCEASLATTVTTPTLTTTGATIQTSATSPVTKTQAPVTQGKTSSATDSGTPNTDSATSNPVTQGKTSSATDSATPNTDSATSNPVTQGKTSSATDSATPNTDTVTSNPVTQGKTSSATDSATPNTDTVTSNPVTQGKTSSATDSATPNTDTVTSNPVTQGKTSSATDSATPNTDSATSNPVTQGKTSSATDSATPNTDSVTSNPVTQVKTSSATDSATPNTDTVTSNPVTQGTTSSATDSATPNTDSVTSNTDSVTSNPVTQVKTSSATDSATPNTDTVTSNPVTQGKTSSATDSATPNTDTVTSNPVTQGKTSSATDSATPNTDTVTSNPVTQGKTSSATDSATPNTDTITSNPVTQGKTSSATDSATPNTDSATSNPVTQGKTSSATDSATPNTDSATSNPVTQVKTSSATDSATPNTDTVTSNHVTQGTTSSATDSATPNTDSVTSNTDSVTSNPVTQEKTSSRSTLSKTTQTPNTPEPVTTTLAAVKTTPHKQPVTNPPVPVTCKVCAGPEFLCEKLYMDKQCEYPNNYCINKLTNHLDGSRSVIRSCGNFDTCYRDWFLGSSDSDKCRRFDENSIITLDFSCTFCCVSDNCNLPIRPNLDTLYIDV